MILTVASTTCPPPRSELAPAAQVKNRPDPPATGHGQDADGEREDGQSGRAKIVVPDPKRGFPQPPVQFGAAKGGKELGGLTWTLDTDKQEPPRRGRERRDTKRRERGHSVAAEGHKTKGGNQRWSSEVMVW